MKHLTLFIAALFLLTMAGCKQGKASIKNEESERMENVEMEEINNDDIDYGPFTQLVAQFTPEQLQEIIGKPQPEGVRDLLLLLPDDDCFNTSIADRRKALAGERVGEDRLGIGEANTQYLNLTGIFEGTWEMYALQKGKRWHIAVNQQECGPLCLTTIAHEYSFLEGKLLRHSAANLAGYQDAWPELFIDFDQLTTQQQEAVHSIWNGNNEQMNMILFRLPRRGNNISMYIDPLAFSDAGVPESAFKEVEAEMWPFDESEWSDAQANETVLFENDKWHITGYWRGSVDAFYVTVNPQRGGSKPYTVETNSFIGVVGDFMVMGLGTSWQSLQVYQISSGKQLPVDDNFTGMIEADADEKGFTFSLMQENPPKLVWNENQKTWEPKGHVPAHLNNEELKELKNVMKGNEFGGMTLSALQTAHVALPAGKVTYRDEYRWQQTDE